MNIDEIEEILRHPIENHADDEPDIDFVGEPVLTEALKIAYNQAIEQEEGQLMRLPNNEQYTTSYEELRRMRGDFVYTLLKTSFFYSLYLVRNFGDFEIVEIKHMLGAH